MWKILLKKQLFEVFRSYFYNAKKNKMRSKWAIAGWFLFFFAVMVGMLGGIFTALSLTICGALAKVGMSWLYFALMGGIAILLGAFGSVFNTYAGLYLSKDNDLLLSMPIPVRVIIAARLANVWLLGAMYAATAIVPAIIVYWVVMGATAARVACGILLFLIITAIVLMLSTLLGWVVAKISLKLKNKSFIAVLASLLFMGGYYFFYFKANSLIQDLVRNAAVYGARIKGAARGVYLFGMIGTGDWTAAALFAAISAALLTGVWIVLSRSFLAIATSSGKTEHVRYREKAVRQKSPFRALLGKEFARYAASPNYILNCSLGVLLLLKGRMLLDVVVRAMPTRPGCVEVLICAVLCLLATMIDTAAPSVSLEGRSLWIPQSLPVAPKAVLRAKALMQWILSAVPMLFAVVCAAAVLRAPAALTLALCLAPLLFTAFYALFCACLAVKLPILSWTNEVAPIKQSASVGIALFGGWAFGFAMGGLYLWVGYRLGPAAYLLIWSALFAAGALALLRWLDTRGSRAFMALD